MNPSIRLGLATLTLAGIGLFIPFDLVVWEFWATLAGLLIAGAAVDAFLLMSEGVPTVTRELPTSLPLAARTEVRLIVNNPLGRTLSGTLHDIHPASMTAEALPMLVTLPARGISHFSYHVHPEERGDQVFDGLDLTLKSPLGLWWRRRRIFRFLKVLGR